MRSGEPMVLVRAFTAVEGPQIVRPSLTAGAEYDKLLDKSPSVNYGPPDVELAPADARSCTTFVTFGPLVFILFLIHWS